MLVEPLLLLRAEIAVGGDMRGGVHRRLRDAERDRLVLGAGRPIGGSEVQPVVQEAARDEQKSGSPESLFT